MNTPKFLAVACAALVLPLAACSDDDDVDDVDDIVDVTSVDPGSLDIDTGTDVTTVPGGAGTTVAP